MRTSLALLALLCSVLFHTGRVQTNSGDGPVVLGHGVGLFKIGPLLMEDDFEDLDNWAIQVEQKSGDQPGRIEVKDGTLDCFLPGRGATIWFKQELKTRVTITYNVLCPTPDKPAKELLPRDINNFWMASDPSGSARALFDSERYTGSFNTYDKMHGYYASTGGGRNTTTRMRRYPREVAGELAEHIALKDKDGKPGFLITPDKVMKVQLVAFDDVIQYIVDGKLIYQMRSGDRIQVEARDADGNAVSRQAVYDLERDSIYREGYFGFRMVGSHHVYSNFKVHALVPADNAR